MRMHAGEVGVDADLVRRLLAAQAPHWSSLPIERVPSSGTGNALFRLGDDVVARLPMVDWAVPDLRCELEWLPRLAPLLPVQIPEPLFVGLESDDYAWPWAVYSWLDGENPGVGRAAPGSLASDLAALLGAFREIDLDGPTTRRGLPLTTQDESARAALDELHEEIDVAGATAVWDDALRAPDWPGPPVWLHGDLLPGNLLVRDGRLSGVIDFGLVGLGDPACDLVAVWSVLPAAERQRVRAELEVDDATWARGRGWALSLGLIALPYYRETNPGFAGVARHLIGEVLADV
jgi:aminoglycoside phosphotransferase (APT) family kinase protein